MPTETNRSQALQSIIQAKIESCGYTGYADEAPDGSTYPYIVYSVDSFTYTDARDDIQLDVDIWDRSPNYQTVEAMADTLEAAFDNYIVHDESSIVLPQFFRYLRTKVPDTDRKLKRINLKFDIQNYSHTAHSSQTPAAPVTEPEEVVEDNDPDAVG